MAQEIEFKLALPPADQGRFLRSPLLRRATRLGSERLVNVYYDTPDLVLYRNGIALRLRQSRRRWLQTVKCAGSSYAGLASRPEWEVPYGGHFDFSSIGDLSVRKRLDRIKHRLGAVFNTDFRRTAWAVREASTELIVALDRGTIVAAGKVVSVSEVEIELVQGDAAHIFRLADELGQHFPLAPCIRSKAERGYRLFLDAPDHPVRAQPIALDSAMAPRTAFRLIALSCLDHLQQNHDGALHSGDAEYIHQMRVAMRRLRAALRLFRAALPPALEEQLLPSLRSLMAVLGATRDLDVLIAEIVAPVVSALPEEPRLAALAGRVAECHQMVRQQAIEVLGAVEYGRLLLLVMARLSTLADGEAVAADSALAAFARAQIKRLRRRVLHLAHGARPDDPASLHALRIAAKRMRYALEFFSPVFPARRTVALIQRTSQLQDTLGQLNDLANAGALLMDCAGDDAGLREAVSLIGGWHGRRYRALLTDVPRLVAKLHKMRLPKAR